MTPFTTQLEQLENAQLVRRALNEDLSYLFKHALTQETAYESLLVKKRREIHRLVAEAYERLYPAQLDDFAAMLVQHYSEAGDTAKTLEYATRAGDRAARLYAHAEALQHYARAIRAANSIGATSEKFIDLYTKRGRVLEVVGRYEDALAGYIELSGLASTRNDRALELVSLILRATAHSTPSPTFDPERAEKLLDQALALAHELGDRPAQARILWNLTLLNAHTGHPDRAIAFGEQSLEIARALHLRDQLAYSLHELYFPYAVMGQTARAQSGMEEARALFRELENKPMLADNLGMTAEYTVLSGDLRRALELAREGARISEQIGNVFGQNYNLTMQATAYWEGGDVERAFACDDQAYQLAEGSGLLLALVLQRAARASRLGMLGAFPEGLEAVRLVLAHIDAPMPAHFRARAWASLAHFYILRGSLAEAESALAEVKHATLREGIISPAIISVPLAETEFAIARGDTAQAERHLNEFIQFLQPLGFRLLMAQARYLQGQLLIAQGQIEQAFGALMEACTAADAIKARHLWWQTLKALSDLTRQRGEEGEALRLRAQTIDVISYIAEHTPPVLRASFLSLPQVREVFEAPV